MLSAFENVAGGYSAGSGSIMSTAPLENTSTIHLESRDVHVTFILGRQYKPPIRKKNKLIFMKIY